MTSRHWRIRLTRQAEIDYSRILDATVERFGSRQADIYEGHLIGALAALEAGPELRGSAARNDIRPDLRTYHLARLGVRARHLICYRAGQGQVIEVLRILHDAMDLPAHIPAQAPEPD